MTASGAVADSAGGALPSVLPDISPTRGDRLAERTRSTVSASSFDRKAGRHHLGRYRLSSPTPADRWKPMVAPTDGGRRHRGRLAQAPWLASAFPVPAGQNHLLGREPVRISMSVGWLSSPAPADRWPAPPAVPHRWGRCPEGRGGRPAQTPAITPSPAPLPCRPDWQLHLHAKPAPSGPARIGPVPTHTGEPKLRIQISSVEAFD